MILHVFNSGSVSGPERLVLPAIAKREDIACLFLVEERLKEKGLSALRYAEKLGVKCYQITLRGRVDCSAFREFSELLKSQKISVLHGHDVKATFYALIASFSLSIPLCSTHHGINGRPDLITKIYEGFYRFFLLPFCARVLSVSREDFLALKKVPFLGQKTFLHLNGIQDPRTEGVMCAKERAQIRKLWNLSDDTVTIGFIGRLSEEKRPLFLIDVAKHLKENSKDYHGRKWRMLIFGEGSLRDAVRERILSYGLEEEVSLMGYDSEISKNLGAFDVIVNCSKHEGLPISLLEAGYAGVPLCVSAVGGNTEVVSTAEHGISVPEDASAAEFSSKLSYLIRNSRSRQGMGDKLREHVSSRFSEKRWMAELIKHYSELSILSMRISS